MDVVFDVELDDAGLDAITGGAAQKGRMIGGLVGGTMIELLSLGDVPTTPEGPHIGYINMSFRVENLDATYDILVTQHPALRTDPAVDGVRMLLTYDRDGTPVELLELAPGVHTTLQLWRPTASGPGD